MPDTKKNPYQSFGASSMNAAPLKPQNNTMKNLATLGTIAAVGAGVGSWLDKKDED